MKLSLKIGMPILSSILLLSVSMTGLAQKTPGFNNKIPENILTPDKVEMRIGTLKFFEGQPAAGLGPLMTSSFASSSTWAPPDPTRGKGGKYLNLSPDYDGELDPPVGGMKAEVGAETYFIAKSTSYVNWLILRGFLRGRLTTATL